MLSKAAKDREVSPTCSIRVLGLSVHVHDPFVMVSLHPDVIVDREQHEELSA
jgi:hypothetical protein